MRRLVTAFTLLGTLALGQAAARADEPLQLTAPAEEPSSSVSVQGIATGVLGAGVPLMGVELGFRTSRSFELQLEYSRFFDESGEDSVGIIGTGFRWKSTGGPVSPYLYGGAAMLLVGGEPIVELPILRAGFGAEVAAANGFFVSAQVGVDFAATEPDEIVPEARVGIGFHF